MKQLGIVLLIALLTVTGCQTQSPVSNRNDERVDVRLRWAKEHIQLLQYEQAKRPLTQALEIDPKNPKVLNLLAFVFQQQGENKLAEKYYTEMLKADPHFSTGQNNFGTFLMLQGRYEEACPRLNEAASNPFYERRPQAMENLASCYAVSGKPQEAEDVYRQVLRLTPDSGSATIGLASMLYERGEKAEARELFNQFAEMVERRRADHSSESLWLGVRIARDGGDVGMAATYALLLKNMFPNSPEYQLYKESR